MVEVLPDNESSGIQWQGTNKVGEFVALLRGASAGDLDLVSIAQEYSK